MRVRYEAVEIGNQDGEERLLASLRSAGIELESCGSSRRLSLVLLFFGSTTNTLWDRLRQLSADGLTRILAVATTACRISDDIAWRFLQSGAADLLRWDRLDNLATDIVARLERWRVIDDLIDSPVVKDNLVGHSSAWKQELRRVTEVARFTDAPILITGETGTGKELLARLVHTLDPRPKKGDLVVVDCTTIVPELSGSEFFGHEKGSFTGAISGRDGAFALANGGTLFLDEIGDLPLNLQAQLLRGVQEHTYKRVGGNQWKEAEFRLVCATNKNLTQAVSSGGFRRDLYYRIAGWTAHLPSLSERREDIIPLAQHFLKNQRGPAAPELDPAVRRYLIQREYPGNIRDLRQLVNRMCYHHVGKGPITCGDIPEAETCSYRPGEFDWHDKSLESAVRQAVCCGVGLREIGRVAADLAVRVALDAENGNLQRAARRLGITDRALQMRTAEQRARLNSAAA